MKITPARIHIPKKDIDTFQKKSGEILSSGQLILGQHTKKFEKDFAQFTGSNYAIAVNSGTSALEIVLRSLNVKDREVIVPSNTFIATANAVRFAGGELVLADMNPETLAPSIDQIKKLISNKTAALVLVHIGGIITPEIEAINDYCKNQGISLVEDAAHAHGSTFKDKHAGTFGDVGTFSFFPTKVITANEGGMIITDNKNIAEMAFAMRDHGKLDRNANFHQIDGNSWRMSEVNALLGHLQLARLPEFIDIRKKIAEYFDRQLDNIDGLNFFLIPESVASNYYKYIVLPESPKFDRNRFKKILKEKYEVGLSGEVYTHGCHLQPVIQESGFRADNFKNVEKFCDTHICLPVYNNMSFNEAAYLIDSIRKAFINFQ